ncbi:hypothetical protein C8R43DRAFT_1152253 [Mycena crocata]|nr:hypothetical protein C8R43DRAFT_1152253 [Mycena crocata]
MSLSFPLDELARMQIFIRVSLHGGGFWFDMKSAAKTCSILDQDVKLNIHGCYDDSGDLVFTISVSQNTDTRLSFNKYLPETPNLAIQQLPAIPSNTKGLHQMQGEVSDFLGLADDSATAANSNITTLPFIGNPSASSDSYAWLQPAWPEFTENPDPKYPIIAGVDQPISSEVAPTLWPSGNPYAPPPISRAATPTPSLPPPYDNLSPLAEPPPPTSPASPLASTPNSNNEQAEIVPEDNLKPRDGPGGRPFRCLHAECPQWFTRAHTRRVHMKTHLAGRNSKAKFLCRFDACRVQFSRKHDRLRHEVGTHGMETRWTCASCNKCFSSEATLERHGRERHGLSSKG